MPLFRSSERRTRMLERCAKEHGLLFSPKDDMGFVKYFSDFSLFRKGMHRKITHLMRRTDTDYQGDYGLFDYRYVVQSGNTPVHFRQTVFYCIDKSLLLPHFRIFPERLQHKVGKWFGMQDINLPLYPDFSKHYILKGTDEEQTRVFFDEDNVVRHFISHSEWHVEGLGYYTVMYLPGKLAGEAGLSDMLTTGKRLSEVLISRSQELEKRVKE